MNCCLSPHNSPAQPLQKAHMRTRQHSLAESPIQTGTDSQKAHMQCCLSLHNSRQHSLTENCFFRHPPVLKTPMRAPQHGLTESPIQTGTNSQKTHMQCCLFFHNSRQHSFTESPLRFPAPARTSLQKAHMRTRAEGFFPNSGPPRFAFLSLARSFGLQTQQTDL